MSSSSDLIEAQWFKRVGDHFVFRAPRSWPLGPARHYVTNEAQRDAIVQRLLSFGSRALVAAFAGWVLAVAVLIAAVEFSTGRDTPTPGDIVIVSVLAVTALILCLHLSVVLTLRPVVAGLPESPEEITARDRREALGRLFPMRSMLPSAVFYSVACAGNAILFVGTNSRGPNIRFYAYWYGPLLSIIFGLLALRSFYVELMLVRTSQAEREVTSLGLRVDPLQGRLDRLELGSRKLREALAVLTALACALGVLMALLHGLTASVVEADRLVLRNSKGESVALLGTDNTGAPSLGLYGPDRKLRLLLGLTQSGSPQVALYSPGQDLRMLAGLGSDGLPVLLLNGADGKARAGLVVNRENAGLVLSDPSAAARLFLTADRAGGHVRALDAAGGDQEHR